MGKELNEEFNKKFKEWSNQWNVIGSDETGVGEAFREIITVAAYVKKSSAPILEDKEVGDSKKFKNNPKRLCKIVQELTGKASYDYFRDHQLEVLKLVEADVLYVISILSNKDFEKDRKNGCNKEDILRSQHAKVLNMLMGYVDEQHNNGNEECYHYVVVDDFQDGRERDHDKIIKMLGNGNDKGKMHEIDVKGNFNNIRPNGEEKEVIIQTKMDDKTLAAGCASMISYYIQMLYIDKITAEMRKKYGLPETIQVPQSTRYVELTNFKKCLDAVDKESKKSVGSTFDGILEEYGKQRFLYDNAYWDDNNQEFVKKRGYRNSIDNSK